MTQPRPEPAPAAVGDGLDVAVPGDAELVARARAGDRLAFELIMRRHNRRLFRLARSILASDAEAEDALQEAYVHAYAKLATLADGAALGTWLARIVTNEALGRLRTAGRVVALDAYRQPGSGEEEGRTAELASDLPDPERLAASGELRRLLAAAVDGLPQEFRSVFVLREVEGLSTAETAAWLAIRPETVKTRLHRARLQLQESLGQQLLAGSPSLFDFDGARCDRIVDQVLTRLGQPTVPGPPFSAAASERSRLSPLWLGRLLGLLTRRRKR
jgi:RNA polymerase sigma-70 factor (ECF subfamily)